MFAILMSSEMLLRRQSEAGGCGVVGCFVFLLVGGFVFFLIMKGRRDRPEQLGASKRALGSAPIADHTFACPYAKCPTCSASGDKMKQQWDGLRKVTWTCGYCGGVAGVQELRDEELPPSARRRLGLDIPHPSMRQEGMGPFPGQGGSGMGGLLTGMMIGSMMNGSHHHRDDGGGNSDSGGDGWNDTGHGDGDSGGDWGDSGGGDSGGDSGGSDW